MQVVAEVSRAGGVRRVSQFGLRGGASTASGTHDHWPALLETGRCSAQFTRRAMSALRSSIVTLQIRTPSVEWGGFTTRSRIWRTLHRENLRRASGQTSQLWVAPLIIFCRLRASASQARKHPWPAERWSDRSRHSAPEGRREAPRWSPGPCALRGGEGGRGRREASQPTEHLPDRSIRIRQTLSEVCTLTSRGSDSGWVGMFRSVWVILLQERRRGKGPSDSEANIRAPVLGDVSRFRNGAGSTSRTKDGRGGKSTKRRGTTVFYRWTVERGRRQSGGRPDGSALNPDGRRFPRTGGGQTGWRASKRRHTASTPERGLCTATQIIYIFFFFFILFNLNY